MNLVLSIRQPWAAFFFCDHPNAKDIENRKWPTKVRGWVRIHAAKTRPTKQELKDAYEVAAYAGLGNPPRPEDLKYGGIIGMAKLVNCVRTSRSRWFFGPFGFVFTEPYPLPFEVSPGQLGFYQYGSINLKHGMDPHP